MEGRSKVADVRKDGQKRRMIETKDEKIKMEEVTTRSKDVRKWEGGEQKERAQEGRELENNKQGRKRG